MDLHPSPPDQSDTVPAEGNPLFSTDAWVAFLATKPIPVRASALGRLRRLLQRDSTTISELATLIHSDPLLSVHVVREAQRRQQRDSHVNSIDHAVSLLGIDPLQALASQIVPLKLNPASVQQTQFLRAVANSHHAACQAQAWSRLRHQANDEEIYLAALFYAVSLWLLWLHAPLHMHTINIAIYEHQCEPAKAEETVLGCTMQRIGEGLSRLWGLSELISQSQDPDTSPSKVLLAKMHQSGLDDSQLNEQDIRQINHLKQQRTFAPKLANWFALAVSRSWHSTRQTNLCDSVADYLGCSHDQAQTLIHQQCVTAARHYHTPGILTPAAHMLLLPSNHLRHYKLGPRELKRLSRHYPPVQPPPPASDSTTESPAQPASATVPAPQPPVTAPPPTKPAPSQSAAAVADTYADAAIYQTCANALLAPDSTVHKPAQILQILLKGLNQGLGLTRISVNLISAKGKRMQAAQVIGIATEHPLANYQGDVSLPGLLSKLCEKPSCVWINTTNRARYLALLPSDYRQCLPAHDCLLMSVFRKGNALALIYADGGEQHTTLSPFQYERFKYLCSGATLAFNRH